MPAARRTSDSGDVKELGDACGPGVVAVADCTAPSADRLLIAARITTVASRTPAISCEAVPAVSRRRGHEAAPLVGCPRNQPGAAESLVSFIALFCGTAPASKLRQPTGRMIT